MSKWISVDDEMPEKEGMYLTSWTDGTIETYDCESIPSFGQGYEMYFTPVSGSTVTHWMPLPDAPT